MPNTVATAAPVATARRRGVPPDQASRGRNRINPESAPIGMAVAWWARTPAALKRWLGPAADARQNLQRCSTQRPLWFRRRGTGLPGEWEQAQTAGTEPLGRVSQRRVLVRPRVAEVALRHHVSRRSCTRRFQARSAARTWPWRIRSGICVTSPCGWPRASFRPPAQRRRTLGVALERRSPPPGTRGCLERRPRPCVSGEGESRQKPSGERSPFLGIGDGRVYGA